MGVHVLVVDDSQRYREGFVNMLRAIFPHVTVSEAEDGSTALSMTRLLQFELVILDYHLTGLSGSDVLRHFRQRAAAGFPVPPIMLMSGDPDVALFTRPAGAVAFLAKPVTEETIRAVIGPHLDGHRQPTTGA